MPEDIKYYVVKQKALPEVLLKVAKVNRLLENCLLYTSPSPRD